MNRLALIIATIFLLLGTASAIEPRQFDTPLQQARYDQLTAELRCLVCAGESIADSNAPLAGDMRDQVYDMIMAGKSNTEVKGFLTDRYGDIVLFRPPLATRTLLLWFGPLLVVAVGAVVLIRTIVARDRAAVSMDAIPDDDRE